MPAEGLLRLRRATLNDVPVLEGWDADPDVIAATTDDGATERAFGGLDWRKELGQGSDASYYLIAEVDGRPIGAMQICDPRVEPTHYWGEIEPNLRAIDIWIGADADRNHGYGREMMRLAHEHCFADPAVTAIVIDPLASNTRAIAFYHRLGYVTVERRAFGDDDCLVLRLTRDTWWRLQPITDARPSVVILAGPNGAGKSTAAPALLQGVLAVSEFVNADVIARGLSAFNPDAAAIAAGRVMLARMRELAAHRTSFAFETTLASRTFAPWLLGLRTSDYEIHLVFLWLSSADLAIERVADRVRNGGHDIPEDVVRRRYAAGIRNLFDLYQSVTTSWVLFNSSGPQPALVAEGLESQPERVYDTEVWATVRQQAKPRGPV